MSAGTPVMITRTLGFWEPDAFKNMENIIFIEENTVDAWSEKIKHAHNNHEMMKKISYSGRKKIEDNNNLEKLTEQLINLI